MIGNTNKNVLELERKSIPEFQKELYNATKEKPLIGTRFSAPIEKQTQSSHIKVKLDQVPTTEGEVVYTASKKYDALLSLQAYVKLFPVRVKDKWKKSISIRYPHNLGHNIFVYGECKIDDEHFGEINSKWLDVYSQYFVSKRDLWDTMVGNIPCLEEWGTELPGKTLIVPQPYTFSRKTQTALPIYKSSSNKITFEYILRTKLVELIEMRYLKNGEYIEIECNLDYLEFQSESIQTPEMWGKYSEITEAERNWRKSTNEHTGLPEKQTMYIEDIVMLSSKNPKPMGAMETIALEVSDPTRHIFWMASPENGKLSNYTTNKEDVYRGWNPCAKSGISYGTADRVRMLSHEHFDLAECYDYDWPNFPREGGYNVHTFTYNPTYISRADNAVVLKECGASLNVRLGDTNPFSSVEQKEEEEYFDEHGEPVPKEFYEHQNGKDDKEKYIVYVINVVMKKMEIYWSDKEGKLKYEFVN